MKSRKIDCNNTPEYSIFFSLRGTLPFIILCVAVLLTACGQDESEVDQRSDAAIQNEETVMQYFDAINARELNTLEAMLTDTVMYGDERLERDEYLELFQANLAVLPEVEVSVTRLVSDGAETVARVTFEGTGKGEYLGHDIDGKEVRWTNTYWFEISDGRIEGYVYNWDQLEFLAQLGVIESPFPEQ